MKYNQTINYTGTIKACYIQGSYNMEIDLEVGKRYKISFIKPTTKKDRTNNGRIVEVLGFTDSFMGDVIVRYLDNNRRGRQGINCLLPFEEE